LAAQFFTTSTHNLSPMTLAVLFAAWWALLAGALLTIRPPAAVGAADVAINRRRSLAVVLLLVTLQAIVVVYELPTIGAEQSSDRIILALRSRDASSDRDKCPWYLESFRNSSFVYLPLALLLRKRGWLSRRVFCLLVAVTCLMAVARMTRAPLMAAMITVWAAWLLLYRPRPLRAWGLMAGGVVAFSAVFLTIQVTLLSRQLHTVEGVQVIEGYYGGSMRAFESIVNGTFPRESGYYSADMFYYVLNKLGVIESYPSLIRPYAGNGTNIYTFLDAYMLDAGFFGVLLGAVLTGAAGGWLFTQASRRHSLIMVTSYGVFVYCVAMAVANNEFIRIGPVLTIILAGSANRLVVRRCGSQRAGTMRAARSLGSHDR
jgi:oligosaccharide repeat unit polymerase